MVDSLHMREPDPKSDAIIGYWSGQVHAEYASASITAELLHWLIQLGVSPDTLLKCHRIVADELEHARLCHAITTELGGNEQIRVNPGSLVNATMDADSLIEKACTVVMRSFCCGETTAIPLFQRMQQSATQPVVCEALSRIIRDEAAHSAFGWNSFAELLEMFPSLQDFARARYAAIAQHHADSYSRSNKKADAQARAWGIISGQEYRQIAQAVRQEKIMPRFSTLLGGVAPAP